MGIQFGNLLGNPLSLTKLIFFSFSQTNFFFQVANFLRPTSSEMELHVIAFLGAMVISTVSAFPIEDGSDLEAVYKAGGADKAPEHEGAAAAYRANKAESMEIDAEEGARAAEMDESREMSERNDIDGFPFPFPRPLSRGRGKLGHGAVVGIQYES